MKHAEMYSPPHAKIRIETGLQVLQAGVLFIKTKGNNTKNIRTNESAIMFVTLIPPITEPIYKQATLRVKCNIER